MMADEGPRSAWDLFREEASAPRIASGWAGVDALLGGGVAAGEVCEVCCTAAAGSSSAATAFCHALCAACCRRRLGTALYVDTCGAFSPQRLARAALAKTTTTSAAAAAVVDDADAAMSRAFVRDVRVARIGDADALCALLLRCCCEGADCCEDEDDDAAAAEFCARLRLVVVDSLGAVLAPAALGSGSGSGRSGGADPRAHAAMVRTARLLRRVARERRAAVVVTNWCASAAASAGTGTTTTGTGACRPALGEAWRAVPHTRIALCCCGGGGDDDGGCSKAAALLLSSTTRECTKP